MHGMKTKSEIQKQEDERIAKEGEDPDKDVKTIPIPSDQFEGYEDINANNEEFFKIKAFQIVITYLEYCFEQQDSILDM